MRASMLLTLVALLLFLLPGVVFATTHWISNSGSDTFGDGTYYSPYLTIAKGIAVAATGDTIWVKAGTYTGEGNRNLRFSGKNLVVRGHGGASSTIIDCGGSPNRAFKFDHAETSGSKVAGFTVRNGDVRTRTEDFIPDRSGGAILVSGSPVIEDCVFENNRALVGGAIQVFNGGAVTCAPTIRRCTFIADSSVEIGGAIACAKNGRATVIDCVFQGNFSGNGGAIGTAIASNLKLTLSNCLLFQNEAGGNGGAIIIQDSASISGCTIIENQAPWGAGVTVTQQGALSLSRCVIAFHDGEAIRQNEATCTIDHSCDDLFANLGGNFAGFADSNAVDGYTIFEDPLFCDTANNDYSISSYSPCAPDNSPCGQLIGRQGVTCSWCCNLAGDVDNSGEVIVNDITYLVNLLFKGGPPAPCPDEADVDGSGATNVGDVTYLTAFLFRGGPAPMCP